MRVIEIANGVTGYWQVLAQVLQFGRKRAPRGKATLELGPTTVVMHNTDHAMPMGVGRNLNPHIGAVEALQLIGAFSSPRLTLAASKNFDQFREPDTGMFHGAYGIRIGNQLAEVIKKLSSDRDTRQAGITLWDPWRDNQPGKRDYPCTVGIWLYLVDDDALEMSVYMRSQDVWWGSPYDWFQFAQLQHTAARLLGVPPGVYRHTTVSTHIYEEFITAAEKVIATEPPDKITWAYQPSGIGRPGDSAFEVMRRASSIGNQREIKDPTQSEKWYIERVHAMLNPLGKETKS